MGQSGPLLYEVLFHIFTVIAKFDFHTYTIILKKCPDFAQSKVGHSDWSSLLCRGSLGFSKGGWRASERTEYIGGVGEENGECAPCFLCLCLTFEASVEERGFGIVVE